MVDNNRSLRIILIHNEMVNVSDKTFRSLLKSLSSICLQVQLEEIKKFIDETPLSKREKQSVYDKSKIKIQGGPVYYVNRVERGSLLIYVIISAFGWFVLQQTLGASIKESFSKTKAHRMIVEFLSSEVRVGNLIEKIKKRILDTNIFGRFFVEKIEVKESAKNNFIDLLIYIMTPDEVRISAKERIDEKRVIELCKQYLKEIDNISKQQKPE